MQYLSSHKTLILIVIYIIILISIPLAFYLWKNQEPKPGNCLILEEKYCKTGTVLQYNDQIVGVGFNLPEKTPVFAPFDGRFNFSTIGLKKDNKSYSYLGVSVGTGIKGDHVWDIDRVFDAYFFDNQKLANQEKVTKGQILGRVNNKKIDYFGEYNLFVYFSKPNKDKFMAFDQDFTLQLFK